MVTIVMVCRVWLNPYLDYSAYYLGLCIDIVFCKHITQLDRQTKEQQIYSDHVTAAPRDQHVGPDNPRIMWHF